MTIKISGKAALIGVGMIIGGVILPRLCPNSRANRIRRYGDIQFFRGVEYGMAVSGLRSLTKNKDWAAKALSFFIFSQK